MRASVSGSKVHSLRVIGCNDETNVRKERNPRNDDDDRYTIEVYKNTSERLDRQPPLTRHGLHLYGDRLGRFPIE